MYNKIIVSLSLEHGIGERAIETARALAADGGEILAVHVYEIMHSSAGAYVPKEDVARSVKAAEESLAEKVKDTPGVKAVLLKGHSGRTITDYAAESNADCIIVGSHKPGLRDYFLGSTVARIVRHAPCSVHVLR
ncbi:MAG: universal stress protein [Rhodobacteraceae bacterium]|nr:universal stress protein [Paracoccaceae bacterium]